MAKKQKFIETDEKQVVLNLAMRLSPDGTAQRGFVKLGREMEKSGEPPQQVLVAVLAGIFDGLKYGNWPRE